MTQTWNLENVSQIAKESPYTFYLPSNEVIKQLEIGDVVKLMFNCDVENDQGWSAERMWVEITSREGDQFQGFLDNDPYYIPDIKAGDELSFNSHHIMQTSLEDPIPNEVDKFLPRCFVTNSVLIDKNPVIQLFREEPDEEYKEKNYSGWNLFSGKEDDDYLNNGDNWNFVSLGAILNIDDKFKYLLDSEFGSEFVWSEAENEYVKI
ncbi:MULTISPECIES: DUF2185 domain-containing protein [unclassified Shewanella]|uniref:immunity protein Imm33 domain-containing protein n=1 Tax=unclassified Shewanella TaxID=196818 RepID=UPI001BC508A6|nr:MULTISPECIES: DUF2185 domain-containing protein [unclassified Shewanella]GIU12383.1 hypothetical protein TUM4444_19640 [Shewanella sp. MBTL60-112-B1]GIU36076.1 hypothetical protein TUM4445_26680 [Shewanella sp. MBTL60-112-B2]